MSITDYMARQTERMAASLAHFVAVTPEERLNWKPTIECNSETRSVLEQVTECVIVNRKIASLLRNKETLPDNEKEDLVFASSLEAQEHLVASASELASSIREMEEEDLSRTYKHPRGLIVGENLIMMPYRNMAYHAGQANFIQCLYGDTDFHVPPTWR